MTDEDLFVNHLMQVYIGYLIHIFVHFVLKGKLDHYMYGI
jgi:hypothetical protein